MKMLQGVKVIIGLIAGLILVTTVSVLVWIVTTVNQLSKDTSKLEQTTQKLTDSTSETSTRINALEANGLETAKEIKNIHKDVDALNTDVGDLVLATGHQLKDIKGAFVEQNLQIDNRINDIEQKNEEYAEKIEELNRRLTPQKPASAASQSTKKPSGRIFVDVNNPNGPVGWQDQYTVQLSFVVADKKNFLIDWYKPHTAEGVSSDKPDVIKKIPKFKNANQLYFLLKLGDAADNSIVGVIDFASTKEKYFPFDLYLDKNRDGDLTNDLISNIDTDSFSHHVRGIKVPYKDGTTEEYALQIYTVQNDDISVCYGTETGRYGVLEANRKRIGILVLDDTGNGLFNDEDDVIFMDLDLDGTINGSSQANEERPLYSILELPGEKYRVTEIDPAGRHLTLTRMH
jgi:hypothetical protein